MKRVSLAVVLALLGSCASTPNPCEGEGQNCITAEIRSEVDDIDQLDVRAGAASALRPEMPRKLQFPLQVAIVLPEGASFPTLVAIVGMRAGEVAATDAHSIDRQKRVRFTLRAPDASTDLSVDEGGQDLETHDATTATDMNVVGIEDLLANSDLSILTDMTVVPDLLQPLDYARPPQDFANCNADQGSCCGNGSAEGPEECDDGNLDNEDSCTNACHIADCGDGFVNGAEECDDANSPFPGCSATCKVEVQYKCTHPPQEPSTCSCQPSACPGGFCGTIGDGCGGTLTCNC